MNPTHRSATGEHLAIVVYTGREAHITHWRADDNQRKTTTQIYSLDKLDSSGNVGGWVKIQKEQRR